MTLVQDVPHEVMLPALSVIRTLMYAVVVDVVVVLVLLRVMLAVMVVPVEVAQELVVIQVQNWVVLVNQDKDLRVDKVVQVRMVELVEVVVVQLKRVQD